MKRKLLAMVCAVSMIASLGAATVYASDDVKATGDEKIAADYNGLYRPALDHPE